MDAKKYHISLPSDIVRMESVGKGSRNKPSTETRPRRYTHGDEYRTEKPERRDRTARNPCHLVDHKTKRAEYNSNNRRETPNLKKKGKEEGEEKGVMGDVPSELAMQPVDSFKPCVMRTHVILDRGNFGLKVG